MKRQIFLVILCLMGLVWAESQAEVWAAYPQFESFQGENGSTLSDQQANLRYRNHLRRAKWLSKVLDQPALEAELSRRVALLEQDSLGLDQSEQSISKLKDPAKREALQLLLADSRVWLKQPVQARGLYRRLLKQGSSETARQVIRRWLHMGEREDLLYLKVLLEQDGRPELITELIRVYPLLGEQSVLLARLKQESRPELRRAMTQALIPILGTAHQGDVIFQLSFLLEDADPLIRGAVAKAMLYSEDPGLIAQAVRLLDDPELAVRREVVSGLSNSEDSQLKERLLSFLDSPDESLRFSALYAAGSLHRPELLPKVLPLLQLENRNELMLVVELVKKWGSAKEIPRLEALLPELGPQERSTVKRAIAYLQGPEQWLAECILQSEASTASGSELGLNLFEALKTRYITQEMLTPYLNHPDPRIRDSVREARRFHVP
ncbi:hypothetical protein COW36_17050 [bacterium (Candidatus Blackallbacteria) CG17_big_fil_post_rev_8_21_14_2_50_48_46]|uniref:HEAT repeat domain-containing protein n=1 Tax=bacterium (Candidatus Blackallbacteria) CG17_big_fil_post_rev_8_21_14_2_50_48_46 TaxID=2014261 RepID=A0A2M7G1F9_9BACT|nr:MAG: hypothetical protein COW64_09360 [bacterium (Candidatus Blackallbacteria) CG18_big_fil_WC_8_21_14_2_50_49_26]PIW15510.1 MAG: hypothetical protein COW36_17050 [bacterium (Candidatus Blackallbacteria) CG17_big_fil_post_rev_8_21_14_2_50_48_46]PIW48589.1 MAG: hypothetical protein COW20_08790 [bacterium (Candidatus Blackallbacteria) CG13_big_fil_rev_8_21_14_2_50_49_14]